jgi:hypothetical protein
MKKEAGMTLAIYTELIRLVSALAEECAKGIGGEAAKDVWGKVRDLLHLGQHPQQADISRAIEARSDIAQELWTFLRKQPLARGAWRVTASAHFENWLLGVCLQADVASHAIDGNTETRWSTGQSQRFGHSFTVDMVTEQRFSKVTLDSGRSVDDYPRSYQVFVSHDGSHWGKPVALGTGAEPIVSVDLGTQQCRYLKVVQLDSECDDWWSIANFNVFP